MRMQKLVYRMNVGDAIETFLGWHWELI